MTDLDFTGKRMLVTGGATGVGAALLDLDWCVEQAGGRLVMPREVASCLAWLGSPASSFVSGVNLNVDMGFSAPASRANSTTRRCWADADSL